MSALVQKDHMPCYLCGSNRFRYRDGEVRDDPTLKIVECLDCELVSLSSLDHIRGGHYEAGGMHGDFAPSIEAWLGETEADDDRRFQMLRGEIANRRVLDFGCGAAGFLLKAQTLAASVAGVEPEERVRSHWEGRIQIHPSLEDSGSGFDLITAFHVIEHLPDPRAVLLQLSRMLGPSGRLVVEVPNANDALLTLYECAEFQRFTYWSQHLYLFNAATMQRLAIQAGLRVTAIRQVQRYPLSNHLHWLGKGKPGGHQRWSFLNTNALSDAYETALASLGRCDTIVAYLEAADGHT